MSDKNSIEIIKWATKQFEESGITYPEQNAQMLLEDVLGKKRFELYLDNSKVTKKPLRCFAKYVMKRCTSMPLAYITGRTEFMSLPFYINPNVFIPRPETEILVETALSKLNNNNTVIDIGTGCGNIAVSIAKYRSCRMLACDISRNALKTAMFNAEANHVKKHLSFLQADMLKSLGNGMYFDLVISNPPYVRRGQIRKLDAEVREFEPPIAIDGGHTGLTFYRILAKESKTVLKKGGYLMVEVGFDQAEDVSRIFRNHYVNIKIRKDYSGINRVVIAQNLYY